MSPSICYEQQLFDCWGKGTLSRLLANSHSSSCYIQETFLLSWAQCTPLLVLWLPTRASWSRLGLGPKITPPSSFLHCISKTKKENITWKKKNPSRSAPRSIWLKISLWFCWEGSPGYQALSPHRITQSCSKYLLRQALCHEPGMRRAVRPSPCFGKEIRHKQIISMQCHRC